MATKKPKAPQKLTPEMLVERVTVFDVDDLRLLEANPNQGDVGAVHTSMEEFGQVDTILVVDGTVVDGNHRVTAERQARRFGGKLAGIDATGLDITAVRAMAMGLALNRTARLGHDDLELLSQALLAIQAEDEALLQAAGWSLEDLDDLLRDIDHPLAGPSSGGIQGDPDDVPDRAPAITKPGDLWLLGPHRLLCGDSTDPSSFDTVMADAAADIVWTDPPYGVSYTGKNAMLNAQDGGNRLETGIEADELDAAGLADMLRASLGAALTHSKPGASWWVAAPCLAQPLRAFAEVLCDLGVWRHTLVWVKDGFVLGRSDYHGRHEQLLYGWAPGGPHNPPPDRSQDSVWEFPRPRKNDLHPTMKPVALIERAIVNHTSPGDTVLDPFGGSGSTLIAAESSGRVARLTELDPHYCDVIARRFQRATGVKPILEATGKAHDFDVDA